MSDFVGEYGVSCWSDARPGVDRSGRDGLDLVLTSCRLLSLLPSGLSCTSVGGISI